MVETVYVDEMMLMLDVMDMLDMLNICVGPLKLIVCRGTNIMCLGGQKLSEYLSPYKQNVCPLDTLCAFSALYSLLFSFRELSREYRELSMRNERAKQGKPKS